MQLGTREAASPRRSYLRKAAAIDGEDHLAVMFARPASAGVRLARNNGQVGPSATP